MFVSTEMKQRVEKHIINKIALAEKHYGLTFPMPTISYDKRGTTAGTANTRTNHIQLNPGLLVENDQMFIDRTVTHELAHLIDEKINPEGHHPQFGRKRDVHGASWKSVMRKLGADPSRCHDYDITNVKKKTTKYVWTCNDCGAKMELGPKRHANQKRSPRYAMKGCGRHHTYSFGGINAPKPLTVGGKKISTDAFNMSDAEFDALKAKADADRKMIAKMKPTRPTPKPDKIKITQRGTKAEQCKVIVRLGISNQETRQEIIWNIMIHCKMTKAGASTYYYNAKKSLGFL